MNICVDDKGKSYKYICLCPVEKEFYIIYEMDTTLKSVINTDDFHLCYTLLNEYRNKQIDNIND